MATTNPRESETLTPMLVNATTAARMLAISPRLLWTLTNTREVPSVRVGRRILYSVESLREWVQSREQPAA